MTPRPVAPMDALWFYADHGAVQAHFGPLMIFDKPVAAPTSFVADLIDEWRGAAGLQPPFNYRLQRLPIPTWDALEDRDIDIDYHLRHACLPPPGGERELGVLVSRLHSQALDPRRPLWECTVIDGLERDRFAVYLKLHHGQFDAVGASRLLMRALSTDPTAPAGPPLWAVPRASRPTETRPTPPRDLGASLARFGRDMRAGALRAVEASWPWTGLGGVSPLEAPRTILNGRISAQRRFAVQTFPISRLRSLAGRGSATINDVFLSLTGGALRSYLEDLGELPTRSLVAQVPISVRAASDESFGNAITYVLLRLGTDIADPVERLRTVSLASAEARRRLSRLSRRAVTAYTTLVAPVMAPTVLGLGGLAPPPANLVVSNVPGPPERLYLNGAAMAHGYGPSVLFHGQALNVTMTSYVDDANISLTGCRVSVPHLQRLALRLGEEVDRLSTVLPA